MTTSFTPGLRTARVGLALAAVLFAALIQSRGAEAAGPRPLFQLPVACGQLWDASTYVGHDDLDSIDLAEWRGDQGVDNMSRSEPVLASAAGTVQTAALDAPGVKPDYGNYVVLDHGGGWTTRYAHLEQLPPLTVGQSVAQGEQIGRIGISGGANNVYHLHYSQLADGEEVRVAFDGKLIKTWSGNSALWGTFGKTNAERFTSANCAGNSFAAFDYGSSHYQLEYKPGNGAAAIDRLNSNGLGVTTVYSATWSKGWTHFAPYTIGGVPHYLAYKSSTGEVDFDRVSITQFGTAVTTVGTMKLSKSYTHFMLLALGGQPYVVTYDSLTGIARILRITTNGASAKKDVYVADWGKGWTHLVPFVQGGVQYFIAYQGGTGAILIDKITGSGDSVAVSVAWAGARSAGASQLVPMYHNGAVHLLAFDAVTGAASFEKINSNGQGTQVMGTASWTRTWTAFTPFSIAGVGYVFGYKIASGTATSLKLRADGTGMSKIWTATWTTGWA